MYYQRLSTYKLVRYRGMSSICTIRGCQHISLFVTGACVQCVVSEVVNIYACSLQGHEFSVYYQRLSTYNLCLSVTGAWVQYVLSEAVDIYACWLQGHEFSVYYQRLSTYILVCYRGMSSVCIKSEAVDIIICLFVTGAWVQCVLSEAVDI